MRWAISPNVPLVSVPEWMAQLSSESLFADHLLRSDCRDASSHHPTLFAFNFYRRCSCTPILHSREFEPHVSFASLFRPALHTESGILSHTTFVTYSLYTAFGEPASRFVVRDTWWTAEWLFVLIVPFELRWPSGSRTRQYHVASVGR